MIARSRRGHPAPSPLPFLSGLLAALVACAVSCGGSAEPAKAGAAESAPAAEARGHDGDGPGAACLRTAGAQRARGAKEPERIGVKHVLVKYAGAKGAPASITRTREEACLRAVEVRDKLVAGADFAAVVGTYSDETGAATRGGSLGQVERKELVPPFADAAFELEPRQLSDVVESPFGFHVILRTD